MAIDCANQLVDDLKDIERDWVANVAAQILRRLLSAANNDSLEFAWAVEGLGVVGRPEDMTALLQISRDSTIADNVRADALESLYLLAGRGMAPSLPTIAAAANSYLETTLLAFRGMLSNEPSELLGQNALLELDLRSPEELIRYLDIVVMLLGEADAKTRESAIAGVRQCTATPFSPAAREAASQLLAEAVKPDAESL